ncbi:hypothetical protein FRAHR75_850016 [Frankia sp. Hr75.2]|nr:hypothetical protein FRAHR75_850016 [Frankia sp. Hr75.2]
MANLTNHSNHVDLATGRATSLSTHRAPGDRLRLAPRAGRPAFPLTTPRVRGRGPGRCYSGGNGPSRLGGDRSVVLKRAAEPR